MSTLDLLVEMKVLLATQKSDLCDQCRGASTYRQHATGEYILGSTDPLSPEGKYVHNVPLFVPSLAFDQSAVGKVTLNAMRYAVLKALQWFQRAGW